MQPFPDLTGLKVFPEMESDTIEFKESINSFSMEKLLPTLCGFLNNRGGYMIFGVTDKGLIKGIHGKREDIDKYILFIDTIHHNRKITYYDGEAVHPSAITTRIIELSGNIRLVVVTATPEPGKQYKCSDGSSWHRLSASNYRVRDESVMAELTRITAKYHAAKSMINEMRNDAKALVGAAKRAEDAARDAREMAKKADTQRKKADAQITTLVKMLETDILKRKVIIEAEHEAARKCSWWSTVTCGLF